MFKFHGYKFFDLHFHLLVNVFFNNKLSIQVYNLHRSPYFWDCPNEFEPERFLVEKKSEDIEGWDGFDPSRSPGALYPNEVIFTCPEFAAALFVFRHI